MGLEWNRDGSVTTPAGFQAAVARCGLRQGPGPDLALILSDHDCSAAGVFTRNLVQAAPVLVDRETLAADPDHIRAVVTNAGVANACTGQAGLLAARRSQQQVAEAVGCRPGQVLVLSTGVIGPQLDLTRLSIGISEAASRLTSAGGSAAARAIMTTDTRPKHLAVSLDLAGGRVTLGGIAKGAGMIHPDMATMLAVLTSDVLAPASQLAAMLTGAVDCSFNCISVDGDTSTNDTVLLLANGASGVTLDSPQAVESFATALEQLCIELAKLIVRDGEGASKFIAIKVQGAASRDQARTVAACIATSALVKTAFAGGDPNWGRILAAAGRAGVSLVPERLSLHVGEGQQAHLELVREGQAVDFSQESAAQAFSSPEVCVRLDLGMGSASATLWTCDLTQEYVSINADYHT